MTKQNKLRIWGPLLSLASFEAAKHKYIHKILSRIYCETNSIILIPK